MSAEFGHIDIEQNAYFAINQNMIFEKVDLKTKLGSYTNIIPNLMIDGCEFKFDSFVSTYIKCIIDNNLGIIVK